MTARRDDVDDLMHRDVVVRHRTELGCTTIVSYVIDGAVDGCSVEVAACVGHLFPLSDVTFLDDDAPV
jgi:hypothetical protein